MIWDLSRDLSTEGCSALCEEEERVGGPVPLPTDQGSRRSHEVWTPSCAEPRFSVRTARNDTVPVISRMVRLSRSRHRMPEADRPAIRVDERAVVDRDAGIVAGHGDAWREHLLHPAHPGGRGHERNRPVGPERHVWREAADIAAETSPGRDLPDQPRRPVGLKRPLTLSPPPTSLKSRSYGDTV